MKDALLALTARGLFLAHGIIAVWKCQSTYKTNTMYVLLGPVLMLFGEGLFTVALRGGQEYKFISPCIALYLGSVVPAIWFLELYAYDERLDRHICQDTRAWLKLSDLKSSAGCELRFHNEVRLNYLIKEYLTAGRNASESELAAEIINERKLPTDTEIKKIFQWNKNVLESMCHDQYDCEFNDTSSCYNESHHNMDNVFLDPAVALEAAAGMSDMENMMDQNEELRIAQEQANEYSAKLEDWINTNIPIFSNDGAWINILHQLILFIIIIGRWMLPKAAGVTRDQLSQILLIFIGVGADILEFVTETIKEMEVRCEQFVIILMLGFWSWSLVQFVLVVTGTTKARTKMTEIYGSQGGSPVMVIEEEIEMSAWEAFWSNPEVWSIMTTIILQDGPFLGMRMYIMFGRKVVNPTLLFFTIKNGIVVLLETYRLAVIATHKEGDSESGEEEEEDDELGDDDLALSGGKKKRKPPPAEAVSTIDVTDEYTAESSMPSEVPKPKKKSKKKGNKDPEPPPPPPPAEEEAPAEPAAPKKKKKKKKEKNKEKV